MFDGAEFFDLVLGHVGPFKDLDDPPFEFSVGQMSMIVDLIIMLGVKIGDTSFYPMGMGNAVKFHVIFHLIKPAFNNNARCCIFES